MPRKPNYKFERMERDRAKAAKKAARLQAKKDRAEQKTQDATGEEQAASEEEAVGMEEAEG